MAIQMQGAKATPSRARTLGQQPWWLLPTALGGLILLGLGIYLLVLLQRIGAELTVLPRMGLLLTNTDGRMERVSVQLDEMNTDVKRLTPLLGHINRNVAHVTPAMEGVNVNLKEATPTLRRLERQLDVTDQRLNTLKQELDALRVPAMQLEATTQRLRKVLPR